MKTKLFLGLAAGLLLASCAQKETLDVERDTIAKADETRYIRVALSNPSAVTKADFEAGTGVENNVATAHFVFYDKNGEPLGPPVQFIDALEWQDDSADQNVEKFATATVPVDVVKGKEIPAYVVCLLNAGNEISVDNTYTMDDLRRITRDDVKSGEGDATVFPMINSVYYGADPFYGENQRIFGTPIEIDQMYPTPEEAVNGKALNIYVERFAAKVSMDLSNVDIAPYTAVPGYTLDFVPVAWGINADESKTYIAKRFADSDADVAPPAFGNINTALGGWWNDAPNHRSYWSCSPAYYSTTFPRVSDDIRDKYAEMEKAAETPNGSGALVGDYRLKYYSYNQLAANAIAKGESNSLYVKENTASIKAFTSENPKSAVPSAVIIGKYTVTPDGGTPIENTTFYLYGGNENLYFEHGSNIEGGKSILEVMLNSQSILAIDENGTLLRTDRLAYYTSNLKVDHPSAGVRANQVVPARFVTLQVGSTAGNLPLYYMDREADGGPSWVQITDNNVDKVNALLMQSVAFAKTFVDGCCYYSVPVKHSGYSSQNGNGNLEPSVKDFDWTKVQAGAFGIVRNHSYSTNVKSIKGLATGLHGLDNPIVPPMDEDKYFVAYRLNILSWAVVGQQDVEL